MSEHTKICPDCDGDGENRDIAEEYYTASEDCCSETCDECDGRGQDNCETCNGSGFGPDNKGDCPDCDGFGYITCPDCEGNGYHVNHCPYCGEELRHSYYHPEAWVTSDGEVICDDCAREAGAYKCETCDGEGTLPHPGATIDGKLYPVSGGMCSCCGGRPVKIGDTDQFGRVKDYEWYIYRAGVLDCDGIPMAYLCGDSDGQGCLSDVLADAERHGERAEGAAILAELSGDDMDGWQADCEDLL
jgi:hypothetical protein